MKYLLYYNLDSKFVTDQTAAGGDGTNVVSVVDGVAWTKDQEKTYYRYSDEESAITSYTVTIHYVYTDEIAGFSKKIAEDETLTISCYKGKTTTVNLAAKEISGYTFKKANEIISVNQNTAYTFYYDEVPSDSVLRAYYKKTGDTKQAIVQLRREDGLYSNGFTVTCGYFSVDGGIRIPLDVSSEMSSGSSGFKYRLYNFPGEVDSIHRVDFFLNTDANSLNQPWFGLFYDCDYLLKVYIPKCFTRIPKSCFYSCFYLDYVYIPETVKIVEDDAFRDVKKLTKIKFYDGLEEIKSRAFQLCSALYEIDLPSTLVKVGASAFYYLRHASIKLICRAEVAPQVENSSFDQMAGGTFYHPTGSDYSTWISKLPSSTWTIIDGLPE